MGLIMWVWCSVGVVQWLHKIDVGVFPGHLLPCVGAGYLTI